MTDKALNDAIASLRRRHKKVLGAIRRLDPAISAELPAKVVFSIPPRFKLAGEDR